MRTASVSSLETAPSASASKKGSFLRRGSKSGGDGGAGLAPSGSRRASCGRAGPAAAAAAAAGVGSTTSRALAATAGERLLRAASRIGSVDDGTFRAAAPPAAGGLRSTPSFTAGAPDPEDLFSGITGIARTSSPDGAAGGRRAISRISSFVVGVRGGAEAADDEYDDESSDEEATLAEL